jgi:hypothetical protein
MKLQFFVFLCCVVILLIALIVLESTYFEKHINSLVIKSKSYRSKIDSSANFSKLSTKTFSKSTSEQIIQNKIDDPYPFSYILNSNETICEPHIPGNNLTFVAFIPSAVHDFHMRMILRSTWANYLFMNRNKMRYVFMIGSSTNEYVNQMV